jgi:hypothetical protein
MYEVKVGNTLFDTLENRLITVVGVRHIFEGETNQLLGQTVEGEFDMDGVVAARMINEGVVTEKSDRTFFIGRWNDAERRYWLNPTE